MKLSKTLKHLFHPQRSNNHRPRFLHPKPLLFLTLIAVGFYQLVGLVATITPSSGSVLGYASNISVSQVIESTNALRASNGAGPLSYNNLLAQAAIAKAQNMFSEGYWAHTSPSGKEPWDFIRAAGYTYRIAGENLARDFDSTPPMMDAWMNSPTHRANIVNPRYQEIGVAVVDGHLNGVETTLVVQMFGAPEAQVVKEPSVVVPAVASVTNTPIPSPESTNTPVPTTESEEVDLFDEVPVVESDEVLAEVAVPQGTLANGILYSPQHVLKAFFLSMILVLLAVLVYDGIVAGHRNSVRFVGKNVAHIIFLLTVMYLIIAFKGGVVGP